MPPINLDDIRGLPELRQEWPSHRRAAKTSSAASVFRPHREIPRTTGLVGPADGLRNYRRNMPAHNMLRCLQLDHPFAEKVLTVSCRSDIFREAARHRCW